MPRTISCMALLPAEQYGRQWNQAVMMEGKMTHNHTKTMNVKTIICAAVLGTVLAACGSSKHVTQEPLKNTAGGETVASENRETLARQAIEEPKTTVQKFMADLDLSVGRDGSSYNLGGKLAMKRGQVVRMNLTFMGFIEVGIIEFTPDYILIVNRMGREYTKAPYNSLDVLVKNNVNFKTVEAMAWKNLYSPDGRKINGSDFGKMIEQLVNSNMKDGGKVTVKVNIGAPNTTRNFETYTSVKPAYKEVPAQVLMAKLMDFAK
ncbi:MAG: DUF4292 domain-containing protein [Bacteroidales bacterium]|nr:DUF4292 domain-containing protein [Bacteroidales bacterium]MCM1146874.1 DUF4292 domain-containing protein [Bacteroidales bacterium]MCM1205628.1 DUF4292 domain-containing protein [Bacillota bacterium]MCM1510261.1 DUF4292 domain-containing protein [Clostridium sp.]